MMIRSVNQRNSRCRMPEMLAKGQPAEPGSEHHYLLNSFLHHLPRTFAHRVQAVKGQSFSPSRCVSILPQSLPPDNNPQRHETASLRPEKVSLENRQHCCCQRNRSSPPAIVG